MGCGRENMARDENTEEDWVEEESIFVQISYSVAPVSKYEFYDGIWCPVLCVYLPSFKNEGSRRTASLISCPVEFFLPFKFADLFDLFACLQPFFGH